MTPKESLHLVSRFTDILSSKCLNSPLTDRVKNLILLLPRLNESLPAIHMVQPCDDLLLKLFGHIARCILDPKFSSLDQKDSSQLYQLIQLGDQTRKKYGRFSEPVNDGSKSSADMAFVGREFTYLLVLLKHQWHHPIIQYMLLGSGQGNIDTAAAPKYLDQQEPTVLLQLRIDLLTEHKRYNEARALCEVCLRQKHITENAKFNAEYIILMAKTGKKQGLLDHCYTISCCTGLRVISELYKKSADVSTTLLPVTQSLMLAQWLYASYSDCTQNLLCEWLKVQKICDDDVRRYQFNIINVVEMHQYSSQILELIMAMDRQFPGEYRQMQLGLCLYIGNMENQHVLWAESTKNTEAESYTHTIHYQLTRVCAHLAKRLSSMLLRISLITSFELQPSANLVDELHTCYKLDPHKSVARIELHKLETKGMIKRLIKEIAILFDRIRPLKINTDLPWNDLSTELNKTLEDYLQRRTEQNITAACVAHHNAKQTANQRKAKSSPTYKQVANQHVANKQAANQQAANQHAPSQQTAMPRASSQLLANKQHPTNVNNIISSTTHKNLARAQNPVQPQHMHTTTQIPAKNNAQVLSTAQPVRPPIPGDSHNKPLNLSQNVTKSIQAKKIVNQATQQSRCKVSPPILPPKVQTSASLQSTNVSHPAQSVATNVQSVSAQGRAAHNGAHVKPQHNVIKGQPVPPPKNRPMPVAPPNNGPVHVTYGALTISGKDVRNASSSPMPVQDVNVGHAQSSTKNAKKGGKMGKVNAHTKPNISPNKVSKRKVVKLPKLPKLDDKSGSVVHSVTQGCNVIKQENTKNNSSTRSIDSFQAAYVATMTAQPTNQQSSVKTGRTFKNYKSVIGNSDGIETSGQKATPKRSNQLVKCQDVIVICAEGGKGGRGGVAGGSRAGASPASMEIPETYISVNRQQDITLDKSHTANVNNQNQRSAKQLAKSNHLGSPFEHLTSYKSPVERTAKVQRVLGSKVSVSKGITNSVPIVGEVAVGGGGGGGGGEGVRFNDKLVKCDNGSCDEVLSIENLSTYGQVLADPANCQKHDSLVKNVDMKLDEESVANTELSTNESSKAKCLEKIYQDMVNKRLNRDIEMISKGIVVKKKDDYTLDKVVNQTLQGSNSIPFKTQQYIYNTLTSLGKRKITSPVTVNNMVQSAPSTAKRKKIEGIVMEHHSNTNVVPINQLSQSTSSSRKVATIARIPDKVVTKRKPDQRASSMSPSGKPGKNTCRMDSKIEKIDQDISVVVMSLQKTLHSIDKASGGSPSASSAQNGMSSAQILATSTVTSTHSGLSTMLHTHVPNLAAATNNASIVSQKSISQPVNGAVLPSTAKQHAGTAHPSVHVPERSPVESGEKVKSILKVLPSAPCAEALMKIEGTIITNSKCKTPKKTAANDVRKSKLKVQGKDSVKDVKAKQLKKTPKKNSQTLRVTRSQVELSSTRK